MLGPHFAQIFSHDRYWDDLHEEGIRAILHRSGAIFTASKHLGVRLPPRPQFGGALATPPPTPLR